MSDRLFVDTNIWIYAHLQRPDDIRCERASRLINEGAGLVISTQVLGEYYSVMLKNRASDEWIQANLNEMMAWCDTTAITVESVRRAHQIRLNCGFSYWDSLIVASALEAGCSMLYSGDLQNGRLIEGVLRVVNPLAG